MYIRLDSNFRLVRRWIWIKWRNSREILDLLCFRVWDHTSYRLCMLKRGCDLDEFVRGWLDSNISQLLDIIRSRFVGSSICTLKRSRYCCRIINRDLFWGFDRWSLIRARISWVISFRLGNFEWLKQFL